MHTDTYLTWDAVEMAEQIRTKQVTPTELVTWSYERMKKVNPKLNAVVHENAEKTIARTKDMKLDDSQPFAGVPLLLKNISQSVKGEPLTSGSRLLKNVKAEHDSNFVKRLRNAGFQFLGHTNAPEFGLKNITEPQIYGATRNPWNINHSPGGSSGGAAAAIASGIVPLAGASDGGGSIRIPASFTGLFGIKPTRGRTPVGPGAGRQWQGASIDFALSRTVRDSAAMLDILQVVQPEAAFQTPLFSGSYAVEMERPFEQKLRIAFSTASPVGTPVSADAKMAVEKTVKWLQAQGHEVEEKENGVDGYQLMRNYYLMNSGEMASLMNDLKQVFGRELTADDMEIEAWVLYQAGETVNAAEFSASLASWDTAAAQMEKLHQTYDFFITPVTAYPAPEVGELTPNDAKQAELKDAIANASASQKQQVVWDMFLPSLTYTPFTQLANLTGQPAMSLPVHLCENGLPLGVQVMAGKGQETRLLQLARQIEQSELWVGMKDNPYFGK
ncbi:amidase [Virgibacillus sp. 179-BFC.A HS]|uniref:Amidase n=1 Tax=Tigheibacillus jepli TaxID=3035914 RepID=A0ABU5CJQ5_9BACI|nr:amidase [Virgibacillus sp. 179-BFC.A HS]MDY0406578.1 amidase [Virgibacillus sp. 179-BFC.A HS]